MDSTTLLRLVPVEYVLKSARYVKKLAYLIAVIGAVASFGTQVGLLQSWGTGTLFSVMIASTVDILAICAAIALQVPNLPSRFKKEFATILVVALGVSIAANIIAGLMESVGAAAAHAWPVFAYMLGEFIASRLRTFVAMVQAAQADKNPPPVQSAPVQATATVGQPKPTPIVASKPGSAKARILELAAAVPPLSPEVIADKVGTKPGWVKHVIKTHSNP